jgi:hypothetical protein
VPVRNLNTAKREMKSESKPGQRKVWRKIGTGEAKKTDKGHSTWFIKRMSLQVKHEFHNQDIGTIKQ